MRIEQLESFVEVADKGSMHKAAESLHTSAQNVSQQIRQLERELNAKLFARNSYGVFTTPDGDYLYNRSKDLLKTVAEIENHFGKGQLSASSKTVVESLNIVGAHASRPIATKLFESLCAKYEIETASLIANDASGINSALEDNPAFYFGEYEVVLTHFSPENFKRMRHICREYQAFELDKIRLGVHVSMQNPVAKLESVSIRDMLDQPMVANKSEGGIPPSVSKTLSDLGIRIKPKYMFNSGQSVSESIQSNMGYGIRPCTTELLGKPLEGDTVIVPLKEHIVMHHVVLTSPRIQNTDLAKDIISILKETNERVERIV